MPLIPSGALRDNLVRAVRTPGPIPCADPDVTPGNDVHHGRTGLGTWSGGGAEEILIRRQSVREFAARPLTRRQLVAIVDSAHQAAHALWPPGTHGIVKFTILAGIYRVSALKTGLYLVDPAAEGDAVTFLQAGSWLESLREEYADAACLLFVCADFGPACRDTGREYGSLVSRAGTLGYAAWLSAIGLGIAGSVYGPSHHLVTKAACSLDIRSRHLFTVALGWPSESDTIRHGERES